MLFLSTNQAFMVIFVVTVGILTIEWAVRRFDKKEYITTAHVSKTLAWMAAAEMIMAFMYAFPFPAPARPGVWILPTAAALTLFFSFAIALMGSEKTPAVQRSRARRAELKK